ncbi:unnamed protein product [Staurois parvus]|uniref:peptide chain release factor N(5)-glutamine methyltransferase n=1 Tax=Staurois parvus TaxID=386267 RepID=A0ABN9EVT4_9NEOB|nr:unnamed protein product [Staurois parvus]
MSPSLPCPASSPERTPDRGLGVLVQPGDRGALSAAVAEGFPRWSGVPEARESSEILIANIALGAKTFRGLAGPQSLMRFSTDAHEKMCAGALKRVPFSTSSGVGLCLDVTLQIRAPACVYPRPETEELVGLVLADCPGLRRAPEPRILEVGCGSGAVSLALLQNIPQARVLAIDKTEAAVNLTRDNAEGLNLQHRIQILQHDVLSDPAEHLLALGPVDAVVSNPPYIFTEDLSTLDPEILRYEDHTALDGGPDGMDVMKAILRLAPLLLKPGGTIFLEGDPRHPDMVQEWLQIHPELQLQLLNVVKDFCRKPRFIHLQRRDGTS